MQSGLRMSTTEPFALIDSDRISGELLGRDRVRVLRYARLLLTIIERKANRGMMPKLGSGTDAAAVALAP